MPLPHLSKIKPHAIQITVLNLPHTPRSIVRKPKKGKTDTGLFWTVEAIFNVATPMSDGIP
jgi:hypothetical protein